MRRLLITCCVFLFALPVLAQTPSAAVTPLPAPPDLIAAASAAASRAEAAASDADRSRDDAARYADDSSRFFSLFEAFGIVAAMASVALGVYGATNVFTERRDRASEHAAFEKELSDARSLIENEMSIQKTDLEALRSELRQNAERQHRNAEHATLAQAILPLGERQYRAQDLKGAAETYQRALDFDEDNPLIHYRLGYVSIQSGALADAETHLRRALEIDGDFVLATAALGYVYRRMGDPLPEGIDRDQIYNRSEMYLLDALKRAPKLIDEDDESWWGSLGGLYRRRGQFDQAIYAYNQAAAVTPHSSYPFSNLALLYMARRERDQMMTMYRHVERLARGEAMADVNNFWAYADILTALLALGRTSEAEEALESVFAIAPPDSPYALESLADTLTRLLDALGGPSAAPHLPTFIQRIRTHAPTP